MNRRQWIGAGLALFVAGSTFAADPAQVPPKPDAFLPAQIRSAKAVFLSNAGIDFHSQSALNATAELPFNLFAQAMQTWGRYQLAASPSEADLVMQFRIMQEFSVPSIYLSILDVKTGVILWTVRSDVSNFKSLRANIQTLMQSLTALVQ